MVFLVKTIITIGIIILFAVLLYFLNKTSRKKRLIAINASRPPLSRERYIRMLVKKGFKKEHIEAYYDVFDNYIGIIGFNLHPDDDIHKMYEVADLDDLELIEQICAKLEIRKPSQEEFDKIRNQFKILTAEAVLSLLRNLEN